MIFDRLKGVCMHTCQMFLKAFFRLWLSVFLALAVLAASFFPLSSNKNVLQPRPTDCCQKTNGRILSNSSGLRFIHYTITHIIKKNSFYSSFPTNSMKHKIHIYIVSQMNYLGQDSSQLTSTRSHVTLVSLYIKRIENTGIENSWSSGGPKKVLSQDWVVYLSPLAALQTKSDCA